MGLDEITKGMRRDYGEVCALGFWSVPTIRGRAGEETEKGH